MYFPTEICLATYIHISVVFFWLIQGLSVVLIQLGNLWFLVELHEKTQNNPFSRLSTVSNNSQLILWRQISWWKYLIVISEM